MGSVVGSRRFGGGHRRRRAASRRAGPLAWLDALPWETPVVIFTVAALGYSAVELTQGPMAPTTFPIERASISGAGFGLCQGAGDTDCVIDGDTIRMGAHSIRIADIDTPETQNYGCATEGALGRRATARMLELVRQGPFDIVRTGARDVDVDDRQLRLLMRDGRSLGAQLVDEGLARPWDGARRSWC